MRRFTKLSACLLVCLLPLMCLSCGNDAAAPSGGGAVSPSGGGAAWDNSSFYRAGHRFADSPDAYYYLDAQDLLQVYDKEAGVSTLLSNEAYTRKELLEDEAKRQASDAYYPGARDIFYDSGSLYIFANSASHVQGERDLWQLSLSDGKRRRLRSFHFDVIPRSCCADGVISLLALRYSESNVMERYIERYDIRENRLLPEIAMPDLEQMDPEWVSVQNVVPYRGRLYLLLEAGDPSSQANKVFLVIADTAAGTAKALNLGAMAVDKAGAGAQITQQAFWRDRLIFHILPKDYLQSETIEVYVSDLAGGNIQKWASSDLRFDLGSNGEELFLEPPETAIADWDWEGEGQLWPKIPFVIRCIGSPSSDALPAKLADWPVERELTGKSFCPTPMGFLVFTGDGKALLVDKEGYGVQALDEHSGEWQPIFTADMRS